MRYTGTLLSVNSESCKMITNVVSYIYFVLWLNFCYFKLVLFVSIIVAIIIGTVQRIICGVVYTCIING